MKKSVTMYRMMWRMRGLLKRVKALSQKSDFPMDWQTEEYRKGEIIDTLWGQNFLSDVRYDFFRRFLLRYFKVDTSNNTWSKLDIWMLRHKKNQRDRIKEVVESCLKRDYLERGHLNAVKIGIKGKEFLQWPRFINAWFGDDEYGKLNAFILGLLGLGTITILWDYIKLWLDTTS